MFPLIAVGLVIVGIALLISIVERNQIEDPNELTRAQDKWDAERVRLDGPIDQGMYRMARPLGTTDFVRSAAKNPALNSLKAKVVASNLYGGSVEVFLAYQAAAIMMGTVFILFAALVPLVWWVKFAVLLFGIGISGLPYNKVSSAVKTKAELTAVSLPEFVDLLQIPIAAGSGVLDSLRFTSRFIDSPVSNEVRWLLDTLAARTMNETDAFRAAGTRIGTPEAQSFFTTLGQAYLEGSEVSKTLARQAQTLRARAHQARRAKIKAFPVKMIVAFAIHFMPLLLVIAMMPLFVSLSSL